MGTKVDYTNTIQVLTEFGNAIIDSYKEKLGSQGYQDGKLFNTIVLQGIKENKGNFNISINLEEYWKYIEYGRKAGAKMPPIKPIENWIIVKQIIPKPLTLKSGKTIIPSTKSLAFVIARSISRKGIKPRPYLKNSIDEMKKIFIERIKDAIAKDLKMIIEG